MSGRIKALDVLVADQRIAPGWVPALRRVAPDIDARVDDCLAWLASAPPLLPTAESAIWRAFKVSPEKVRVLILGQDPYPNVDHAVGLSFSTGPGGPVPASLKNIYAELRLSDYEPPDHGDLSAWSAEGVMLLNRALTLPLDPMSRPRRHYGNWAPIVIATMKAIAIEAENRPVAALLWGVPAQRMRKHLGPSVKVFASSHPAPLSVNRTAGGEKPFRGSRPFAEVNEWFLSRNEKEVDWTLSN